MNARIAFCILILGATSAVAGYAGLNISFPHDSLWMKLFAALIAAAIGVAVATFWHIAFQVVLKVIQRRLQFLAWAVVIVGCLAITGMSAAWHVAAIGGDAALTAAIYETLDAGETALSDNARSRNGYRGFQSRLSGFYDEVGSLAACEDAIGCITGTPGKQGVYGTLIGMQGKIEGIIKAIAEDDRLSDTRLAEGRKCLADFRAVLSAGTAGGDGSAAASAAFDCVNAAVGAIDGNGQLERIAQEMDSLTAGLVLPVSVKTAAQKQAVENILASLRERAASIAADARKAVTPATIGTISLERMSAMKAVIVYWDEIVAAWVTGIALDLIPVLFLAFEAIRVTSTRALPDADTEISITEAIQTRKALNALEVAMMPKASISEYQKTIEATAEPSRTVPFYADDNSPPYHEEEIEYREEDAPERGRENV